MKHIYINKHQLIDIQKKGKNNIYILSNNTRIYSKDFKKIETECPCCHAIRPIKKLYNFNLKKASDCHKCKSIGSKNGFFNKKHTSITKKIISKKNKNKLKGSKNPMFNKSLLSHWTLLYGKEKAKEKYDEYIKKLSISLSGEKNPFFGKNHTEKTLRIIKEKNIIYRNNLSKEKKEEISQKLSNSQKELYRKNPVDYINKRSKAGKITATKQNRYKINKIEKIVSDKLKELNICFEYSVILNYYQFDFGSKDHKILLEVQGDYWHGNPKIYKKNELNNTQKLIIKKDKKKIKFAKKHKIKLYHIWEYDILRNNFSVLEEIKNEINTRTNN